MQRVAVGIIRALSSEQLMSFEKCTILKKFKLILQNFQVPLVAVDLNSVACDGQLFEKHMSTRPGFDWLNQVLKFFPGHSVI